MEIEILPPEGEDKEKFYQAFKQAERQETVGCLVMGLMVSVFLFVFLSLLPVFLVMLGSIIAITTVYLIYKMWLETPILDFIEKHHSHKK